MSSLDSVSTVYKCMLSGAADFLLKPLRKNELMNLWQHVWRRQAARSGGKHGPRDKGDAQQKRETTAENNATTSNNNNNSTGYMACVKRDGEYTAKGSDVQSSCTKPDSKANRAYPEHVPDVSQPKWSKSSDLKLQNHEEYVKSSMQVLLMHDNEAGGLLAAASKNANTTSSQGEDLGPESLWKCSNIIYEDCDKTRAVTNNSSREAIDLIGAFIDHPKCSSSYRGSGLNYDKNKVDSSPPLLDLSLTRSHPTIVSVNQIRDERPGLKHSDASAFSRFINKTWHPLQSSSATVCHQREDSYEANSEKRLTNHVLDYNSDTHGSAVNCQKNIIFLFNS